MRMFSLGLWMVVGGAGCGSSVDFGDQLASPGADLATHESADLALDNSFDIRSSVADLASMPAHDLAMAASYPPGPYGPEVGNVFPPLLWEGYVDLAGDAVATTKPYGPYLMDDVRASGRAYAMIHVSEFI